ncbi:MAG: toprim domain-containing protein [Deltaproteobacteria bacterium]|nr:toprim domain-containing protein [Deltaproteobacteria bacterium]
MARIPTDELERLKREVPIAELVAAAGVKLERHGQDLRGLCPFHDDTDPSLVVTPLKNLWHCLGACRAGGSVVDWVMRERKVSFRRAVDVLLELHPSHEPAALALDVAEAQLLDEVAGYYHRTLKESPEALAYLEERGLSSPEMIDIFKLGYANRTLGYRLPERHTKAGVEIRERLERLGVLRDSGHEHLTGSLVVPLVDEGGRVVNLYGRKIAPAGSLRRGTPLHLYLPGPQRGVFNPAAFSSSSIIVCEALIDALTFWCHGFRNVTSIYGVEGMTDELFARLCKAERVLLAYDADDAGNAAAAAHAARLLAAGVEVFRVQLPKGMDANEYARKVTPAAKSLRLVLDQAVPMGPVKPRPVAVPAAEAAKEEQPAAPPLATPAAVDAEVSLQLGDRRWRARGLGKNLTRSALRCTLFGERGGALFVDSLDLYAAKGRAHFVREAARELSLDEDLVKSDLAKLMMALEDEVDRRLRAALAPKRTAPALTADEEAEATALLSDPLLLEHVLSDLNKCGVVGEETNKLTAYLAMTSRKLEDPLAVIVQSSSAAGKSSLMEAVLSFCPEEDLEKYSAMTGQSLFYMGAVDLKHKVLAVVEEEGAERASYALKLLQSEKELTIASTGKDGETGKLITHEYRVEGPVMIMLTTTAADVDEELLNRCLVLSVDEERAQTRAIHDAQRRRRTLDGIVERRRKESLQKLHKNAQRLLRPLAVVNPFALKLTFRDDKTRTRRDHNKYLGLIDAIALVHQHQRELGVKDGVEYIEATAADVKLANRLAHEVLGRSLDELPPQTRVVLQKLRAYVDERAQRDSVDAGAVRFSRREAREALGLGDTQLRVHLERLADLELVLLHRAGARFVYELCFTGEGDEGARFLPGLVDPTASTAVGTTATSRGSEGHFAGVSRAPRGPVAGGSRPPVVDEERENGAKRGVPGSTARRPTVETTDAAAE